MLSKVSQVQFNEGEEERLSMKKTAEDACKGVEEAKTLVRKFEEELIKHGNWDYEPQSTGSFPTGIVSVTKGLPASSCHCFSDVLVPLPEMTSTFDDFNEDEMTCDKNAPSLSGDSGSEEDPECIDEPNHTIGVLNNKKEIVRLISLRENSKDVKSASSNNKNVKFRRRLYQKIEAVGDSNAIRAAITISDPVKVTPMLSGRCFLRKIHLHEISKGCNDVLKKLTSEDRSESEDGENEETLEVENIIDQRINKSNECPEFKVRFKGYSEDGDQWLPASEFNQTINFTTTSSYSGRLIKRKIMDYENPSKEEKTMNINKKFKTSVLKPKPDKKTFTEVSASTSNQLTNNFSHGDVVPSVTTIMENEVITTLRKCRRLGKKNTEGEIWTNSTICGFGDFARRQQMTTMAGISDTDLVRKGENKVPLKCSLCKHVYDVTDRLPKYLPCLHTFCAICLASDVELSDLKDNTTKQINEVEHFFSEFIKKINSRKQQLVSEIEKQHDVLETSLNIEKKKLQMRQHIVDTSVKFTEFTLKYDSDVELLTTKYDVCSQLDKVSSQTIPDHKSTTEQFPRFFHPQSVNLNMVNNTVFSGHHGKISCDVTNSDAVVGKTCNFTITPRDMNGKQLGVSAIPVEVTLSDPVNRNMVTTTDDNGDGTYMVKYIPQREGTHHVAVTLYSTPIEGSPYIIDVKPARKIKCDVHTHGRVVNMDCTTTIRYLADMEALPALVRDPESLPVETHITTKHEVTFRPTKVGRHEIVLNKYGAPADCNPYIIDVIDTKGLWKVGRTGVNNEEFNIPIDVSVNKKGNVLVADAGNKRIQILDSNGKYIGHILVDLPHISGVAMAPNGNIVVVEWETKHVHVYNENREKIKQFTYKEFVKPYGITVNSKGHILVADPEASYIFMFTSDGDFIMKIGKEEGEGKLNNPHFVATGRKDDVIVSDSRHGLALFTQRGQFKRGIHQIGDDDKLYDSNGVAVDSHYNIVVADQGSTPNRILVLTYFGTVIQCLESQHNKLSSPHGVAVTQDGYVIVADANNDCIKKYKL
uniref:Tripartite motif-containing protein 2-like n=1 Tax=Saccoglossus kowalevskii TaxID=10224 RepID=A0ABM0MZS2_SACKO|nr:PREDICTED: tripartite motif-containing protein 2-like [Saccoglossus kowalevskii]